MPLYEFVCEKCEREFEVLVRSARERVGPCPQCGSARVAKKFSAFASAGPAGNSTAASACSGTPHACGRCGSH